MAFGARFVAVSLLLCCAARAAPASAQERSKPKVRAITGFVRLDRGQYLKQVSDALEVLRAARRDFEKQGYEVESLRIVTQPLGELVKGQSETDALAFLEALDDLSAKEKFLPNVGPAMLRDADDPRIMSRESWARSREAADGPAWEDRVAAYSASGTAGAMTASARRLTVAAVRSAVAVTRPKSRTGLRMGSSIGDLLPRCEAG